MKITQASPLSVGCPNGQAMISTKSTQLAIPNVPTIANSARVFDDLKTGNLLSIGQLCDSDCKATFTKTKVTISNKEDEVVLKGPRDPRTGLWTVDIPLTNKTSTDQRSSHEQVANGLLRAKTTKSDLAMYHSASLGNPTPSTLLPAIKAGFLKSFPGLTENLITKHLPKSIETSMGHLNQQYQGTQSTKSTPTPPTTPSADPTSLPDGPEKTNVIMAAIHDITHREGAAFGDLAGKYPIASNKGNNYILVIYHYDSNAILAEPMKTRNKGEILQTYRKIHTKLTLQGMKPKLQMLDNEVSTILLNYMQKNKIEVQLAPPHMHRQNLAERAIRTFKEHFVSIRAGCDPKFPKNLWCRLITQAVITLNLMRASRIHPKLSAYSCINGEFDYNKTPLAPAGTKVLVHEKPKQRGSWDDHGIQGWYITPSINHYRCYNCYLPSTNGERDSDTVEFFPHVAPMPQQSGADQAIQAVRDLIHTIRNPSPASPFPTFGPSHTSALSQLADIFDTKEEFLVPPDPAAAATRVSKKTPLPAAAATRVSTERTPAAAAASAIPIQTIDDKNAALIDQLLNQEYIMHQANAVVDPATGLSLEYEDLIKNPLTKRAWDFSAANEFGRLLNGVGERMPTGTNTMVPIHRNQIPDGRTATYCKFVCNKRPQKDEENRTRLTAGGNLINYPGDVSTPTADMTTAKILLNSTISDPTAKWLCLDVKDFYLNNEMKRFEYVRIPFHLIPVEIQQQYDLEQYVINGYVYFEVRKGMYGLPQAGRLSYIALIKYLQLRGCTLTGFTPGLFKHETQETMFSLVFDDFGLKYTAKNDALHLIDTLKKKIPASL